MVTIHLAIVSVSQISGAESIISHLHDHYQVVSLNRSSTQALGVTPLSNPTLEPGFRETNSLSY